MGEAAVPLLGAWGLPGVVVAILLAIYLLPQIPGKWKHRNGNGRSPQTDALVADLRDLRKQVVDQQLSTAEKLGEYRRVADTVHTDLSKIGGRIDTARGELLAEIRSIGSKVNDAQAAWRHQFEERYEERFDSRMGQLAKEIDEIKEFQRDFLKQDRARRNEP